MISSNKKSTKKISREKRKHTKIIQNMKLENEKQLEDIEKEWIIIKDDIEYFQGFLIVF